MIPQKSEEADFRMRSASTLMRLYPQELTFTIPGGRADRRIGRRCTPKTRCEVNGRADAGNLEKLLHSKPVP